MTGYSDSASNQGHVERPMLVDPAIGLTCTIEVYPVEGGFRSKYKIVLIDPSKRVIGHEFFRTWATPFEAWTQAIVESTARLARLAVSNE